MKSSIMLPQRLTDWFNHRQPLFTLIITMMIVLGMAFCLPAQSQPQPSVTKAVKTEVVQTAKEIKKEVAPTPVTETATAATTAPADSNMIRFDDPSAIWPALAVLIMLELGVIGYFFFKVRHLKSNLDQEKNRYSQLTQQLEFQALYDPLTQLPNRRLFRDRLLQTIKACNRNKSTFGVIMCDLDHFKEVNDTLGHDAGDYLLTEVTNRLRKHIRDSDTMARLGGDEFAFISPSVHDPSSAAVICKRMIEVMKPPIIIKGQAFNIGLSLGVVLYPAHASDHEMLLRRADLAMYRAKQKRNAFVMFDPEVDRPPRRDNLS